MILEPQENIIARAQDPKEGDTYTHGDDRVTVASVGDGVVRYQYFHRAGVRDLEVETHVWHSIVRKSIEGGAEVSFA
jgi:hypothetical protein